MSKQITTEDLAKLVTTLLTHPDALGQLAEYKQFSAFMTDITEVVCNHCGGEVHSPADDFAEEWMISVAGNESLPDDGGVWKDFDTEGQL